MPKRWKVENCLSRSLRVTFNVAILGFCFKLPSSFFHASIAFSFFFRVHSVATSAFVNCSTALPST